MGNALHQAVLQACRNFMIPIARFLLRNGVTFKEFAEVAKWAFVQVASEEYGIRGRKTNISRVSVMTGLSRKDVTKAREQEFKSLLDETEWSLPARVLQRWYLSDAYRTRTGLPRSLSREEFSALVDLVSTNASVVAVRQELLRSRCIRLDAEEMLVPVGRYFVPQPHDLRAIEYVGLALRNLATTLDRNLAPEADGERFFERTSLSWLLPATLVKDFFKRFTPRAERLLADADDWMVSYESEAESPGMTGIGIYFFSDCPDQPTAM
jgi:hypothetical protein